MPTLHHSDPNLSFMAEGLSSHKSRPKTFPPGRACEVDGCRAVLSIYNSGTTCATHSPLQLVTHSSVGREQRGAA
jgi:hypothetical protein